MDERERVEIELHRPWLLLLLAALFLSAGAILIGSRIGDALDVASIGSLLPLLIRVGMALAALVLLVFVMSKYLRHPAFVVVIDQTGITVPSWKKGETSVTIPWSEIVALQDASPRLAIATAARRHYLHRIWFRAPWSLAKVRAEIEKRRAAR